MGETHCSGKNQTNAAADHRENPKPEPLTGWVKPQMLDYSTVARIWGATKTTVPQTKPQNFLHEHTSYFTFHMTHKALIAYSPSSHEHYVMLQY
jgi:hypothetical protein